MTDPNALDDRSFELLGTVVHTQIHTDRMVNGGIYESEKITVVDELWLTDDGVVGVADSVAMLHGHHRHHPNKSRKENPKKFLPGRLLSIGFSGHHRQICEQFRDVPVGIAAEDVIVDCDRTVTLDEVAKGVQFRSRDGFVDLAGGEVAKPCVPFTKFLLDDANAADDVVAENRAFLDNGMRGFIFGLSFPGESARIVAGAELWRVV